MSPAYWPLAIPSWGAEERAAAHRVIDSDAHTTGAEVKAFEEELAAHIGVKYVVMTNSGSSANLLAAAVMRHRLGPSSPGRYHEIIVPAVAWSTTYAPLHQFGFGLVVADIDPETLNMDIDQARAAVSPFTRGIVGCSILGTPTRLDEIETIAKANHLFFFEDNCESVGAALGGRFCGSFGDVSTVSFFFSHHLNTTEGGALLTNDPFLRDLAVCLRAHGWARDLVPDSPLLDRPGPESDLPGGYRFLLPGFNVRSTELAAAVGRVQLSRLLEMNNLRRRNAQNFHVLFDGDPRWVCQRQGEGAYAVPFGFTLVFRHPHQRAIAARAMGEAGIEHRLITGGSFRKHPVSSHYHFRYAAGGTPHADHMHECGLFVGNHAVDLQPQILRLHEILHREITR